MANKTKNETKRLPEKIKPGAQPKKEPNASVADKEIMQIKPVVTEKAVMLIESQNVLTFKFPLNASKEGMKKEIESLFEVKVDGIRSMSRDGKKYAYVKLNPKNPAIDVATKLGMI